MSRLLLVAALLPSLAFADTWSVLIVDPGPNKIQLIKEVRQATGLGLREAKDLVEAKMPQLVREGLTQPEALAFAKDIERSGARVEVRSTAGSVVARPTEPTTAATTGFAVRLESFTSKLVCIKVVREATGLGLADTKKLVESAPVVVKERLTRAQAEVLVTSLGQVGAKATLIEPK